MNMTQRRQIFVIRASANNGEDLRIEAWSMDDAITKFGRTIGLIVQVTETSFENEIGFTIGTGLRFTVWPDGQLRDV